MLMESAISVRNEEQREGRLAGAETGSLYHSNQVAAFDYEEGHASFAMRITRCVCRAFEAIGASSATQQIVFWNLSVTKNLGQDEIVDKPAEFISGLHSIYGDAAMVIYKYKLMKEIAKEFSLTETELGTIMDSSFAGALQFLEQRITH